MQSQSQKGSFTGLSEPILLHQLFEKRVAENPEATALIFKDQFLTYAALNRQADDLCLQILKQAKNEPLIGISCTPSISMVISVLAVLKSGKGFIALDTAFDHNRLVLMTENSDIRFMMHSEDDAFFSAFGLQFIQENQPINVLDHNAHKDHDIRYNKSDLAGNTAYVVYTSGSTGSAKGVEIKHESILNYTLNALSNYCSDKSENTCTYFHLNLAFDASLTALFAGLSSGKALVIASKEYGNAFQDPNFLKHAPYDFLKITPYQFYELESIGDEQTLRASQCYVVGGEVLHYRHLNCLRNKNISVDIINEYGPSETSVGCITHRFNSMEYDIERPFGVPVGKAMQGVKAYVLNEHLKEVKPQEYGEIVIGGIQVASSYVKRDDLSRDKFIPDIFSDSSAILYKTGDFAAVNQQGVIEYICREEKLSSVQQKQFQTCKIEMDLMQISGVKHALVICNDTFDKTQIPVGYIWMDDQTKGLNSIHRDLNRIFGLQAYSSVFILMKDFPLTLNKKLDRHRLPKPVWIKDLKTCHLNINGNISIPNPSEIVYVPSIYKGLRWTRFGLKQGISLPIERVMNEKRKIKYNLLLRFIGKQPYFAQGNRS